MSTTDHEGHGRGPLIVVAGSLAQRRGRGGHAWVFLQYLLGLRRLGAEVLFLDQLRGDACTCRGQDTSDGCAQAWAYLQGVMAPQGLAGRVVLLHAGEEVFGASRADLAPRLGEAALLLNVMGYLEDPGLLRLPRRRVFLDIDPGFGQMWHDLGLADIFAGHDRHVTVGMNLGTPRSRVPTAGCDWITTPPPVVIEAWRTASAPGQRWTSVCTWRGPFGPISHEGVTYGLRVHEFRKLLPLPFKTGATFELALDIDAADDGDRQSLIDAGWGLVDPAAVAGCAAAYRDYIQASRAELMVAKNLYVATGGGWFSDRSACYLASGRPVVAQDTGLAQQWGTEEGLLFFSDLDEAATAVQRVESDLPAHAAAAAEIAEARFDSDRVLSRLLDLLEVT